MAVQTYSISAANAAVNQTLNTSPFIFWNGGAKMSFRAQGSQIVLKGVQASGTVTVYVDGVSWGTIGTGSSHDDTVYSGADQWVTVEIDVTGSFLALAAVAFVEVTGAVPALEPDPDIGRWYDPSILGNLVGPTGTLSVLAIAQYFSVQAKAVSVLVKKSGTGGGNDVSDSGWTDGVEHAQDDVVVSPVWGTYKRMTAGGDTSVKQEHLIRCHYLVTLSDVIIQSGTVDPDPTPTTDWGVVLVVSGTSLTISGREAGNRFGAYPDQFVPATNGRIKVLNYGVGGSQLWPGDGVTFPSMEELVPQLVDALQLASIPCLWVGHLVNDTGDSHDGVPKTPAQWRDKYVEIITNIRAAVPNLTRNWLAGIETSYFADRRPLWQPAQTEAVAILNLVDDPNICVYVPTDDGSPPFYTTVSLIDGIHPDAAGATTIANHLAPYMVRYLDRDILTFNQTVGGTATQWARYYDNLEGEWAESLETYNGNHPKQLVLNRAYDRVTVIEGTRVLADFRPNNPSIGTISHVNTAITANWTGGESGYEYKLDGDSSWTDVGTTTSVGFNATAGLRTFYLRARNSRGVRGLSSSSDFISGTGPLPPPASVTISQLFQSVTVTWTAVPEATGYKLEVDGTFPSVPQTDVGNVLSYTLTLSGGSHFVNVSAYNVDEPQGQRRTSSTFTVIASAPAVDWNAATILVGEDNPVSSWVSGAYTASQATGSKKPRLDTVSGRVGVMFDGVTYEMTHDYAGSANFTAFFVVTNDNAAQASYATLYEDTQFRAYMAPGSNEWGSYTGAGNFTAGEALPIGSSILAYRYNGTNFTLWRDGSQKATTANVPAGNVGVIGGEGGSRYFDGWVHRISAFGASLSDADMGRVFNQLGDLYGITV